MDWATPWRRPELTEIAGMNKITASEANRQFSKLLQNVRAGESYVITSHGKVVAQLIPPTIQNDGERRKAWDRLLKRLEKQPARNSGPWSRDEAYD
jgi:prevent-host-death family protein